jgi:pimeloyl-ACP methyl ester carboxylesterase
VVRNWSLSDRWQEIGSPGQRGRILTLGHGRDVVFLASPLARGDSYIPTARALARYFRTHLIEMPGSGASTRLMSPWSVNEYTAWAAEIIAARDLGGSMVIGQSYSGTVAIALAARDPELVRDLIVADSSGAGEPPSFLRGLGGALVDVVLDLRLVAVAWPHVVGDALIHRRNFFTLLRESLTADISVLARQVTAPTLVAWGGRSQFMRPTAAHTLAAWLPRSRVYFCARGGHTWVVSRAEEFAAAVLAFSEPEA